MNLIKSRPQDIQSIVGNGLNIYVSGQDGYLYLKDVRGNVQSILDYIPALNPAVATVSNSQIQTITANTQKAITYDITDIALNVNIQNGSKLVTEINGYYNLQFSAQYKSSAGGSQSSTIWLKKNGNNVANSSTDITLKNNEYAVVALNFVVFLQAGEYLELFWSATSNQVVLDALPARTNPIRPAVPSIITTITRVG